MVVPLNAAYKVRVAYALRDAAGPGGGMEDIAVPGADAQVAGMSPIHDDGQEAFSWFLRPLRQEYRNVFPEESGGFRDIKSVGVIVGQFGKADAKLFREDQADETVAVAALPVPAVRKEGDPDIVSYPPVHQKYIPAKSSGE
jgi:hypothetical protein